MSPIKVQRECIGNNEDWHKPVIYSSTVVVRLYRIKYNLSNLWSMKALIIDGVAEEGGAVDLVGSI